MYIEERDDPRGVGSTKDLPQWEQPVGHTALHAAAGQGHIRIVEKLLKFDTDVNTRDACNGTALHWAVNQGRMQAAGLLLGAGSDVHARDEEGFTPIHCAAGMNIRH